MKEIEATLFTTQDISSKSIAESFFKKAESLSIQPNFVSFYEPIKDMYSLDKAVNYWCKEKDGCWDIEKDRFIGKSGGLLAKKKEISMTYMISWWRRPDRTCVNYITFYISVSKYKKVEKEFKELFKYAISLTNAVYGYIAHSDTIERQHATGKIEHRIPGMFWCNYFSNIYVDFFGKEKFESDFWFGKEEFPNGTIVYLDERPDKRLLLDSSIEENAKIFLGYDSFANRKEEEIQKMDTVKRANTDPTQYKNVPKII